MTLIGPGLNVLTHGNNLSDLDQLFQGSILQSALGSYSASIRSQDLIGILLALSLIRALTQASTTFIWETISEKIAVRIRRDIFSEFLGTDPATRATPEVTNNEQNLASSLGSDTKLLKEYIAHFFGGIPREATIAVSQLIALIFLSPQLFLIFVCVVAPSLVVVRYLGKKLKQRSRNALDTNAELAEWIQQRLLGLEIIKNYRTEDDEINKMTVLTGDVFHRYCRVAELKARVSPFLEFGTAAATAVTLYFSLSLILSGEITGAVLISFLAGVGVSGQSLANCSRYYRMNKEAGAAIDRLQNILTELRHKRPPDLADERKQQRAVVKVQNVWFQYPNSSSYVFENFSYEFEPGKIYVIEGPSGAGKSSLIKLLLGLQRPDSGQIDLGISRGEVGYVPQQNILMKSSIADNIIYPDTSSKPFDLKNAIEQACLTRFLAKLPDGVNSTFENNRTISGGQMQRILIARMFYHSYRLWILDEPTSALDYSTERSIMRNIQRQVKARQTTVVIVSHRNLAEFADATIRIPTLGGTV